MPEILLETRDLSKQFVIKGKGLLTAVNHVNLSIGRGETVGLVGESGCGKTTLGRTIMKIYQPDGGDILWKGKSIFRMNKKETLAYRKDVQMVFQDPYASLDPLKVISQSIEEGLVIHGIGSRQERIRRVHELLEMVGLNSEHANRFPHEFSGGQRQRIGIARALAVEPQLIVCDEPISALDVSIQAQVVNLLMRLQREMALSYLFITHDLSMVRAIADRIAVMYLGTLVELAPAETLYSDHRHPYTQALLSAIPIPDPDIEAERQRILLKGDIPSPVNLGPGCPFASRCPYADEQCRISAPALRQVAGNHFVACHHML